MAIRQTILIIALSILISSCSKKPERKIDFADPMIGTGAHGHTFPGATTPFGMVQLSPSNGFKAWDWCAGYHYSDSILKGFAHNHISGAGLSGLGDFLFMPTHGELKVQAGTEEDPESGFRSRFSHKREKASPGYYSVMLDDYDIQVELTATPRVGVHRYTCEKEGKLNVIVDPTHNISERMFDAGVEIISDTEIRGYKTSNGEAGKRTSYFHAKFSLPFTEFGIAENDIVLSSKKSGSGLKTKSFVRFDVKKGQKLEVKVALSYVSYEGAKKNLQAEAANKNFDQVLTEAQNLWEEKLSKIDVSTDDIADKRTFYSGMYHAYISPNLISDVDGKYVIEGKQYHSSFPHYSNFSTWDTYRALHPLFTIIEHKATADFVNSLASRHHVSKVGLPIWELLGHDNACMIGYNAVSPMAEAVLKNIEGVQVERVYDAIRATALSTEKHSPNYDKNGMEEYLKLGYITSRIGCSVSKTTEQNYYDWSISKVAEMLNKKEDADFFKERSTGYRSMYNSKEKFLYPKRATGEWEMMSMSTWDDLKRNYISGNIWGYSTYVPHDMESLIEMIGGKEAYNAWLDGIFNDTTAIGGHRHVDISGFIGKYGHGDEPSQHMPYLYNYSGQPWKTQALIPQVINLFYNDTPEGLINNEDLGQMSAWYIFSSLGFYPVNPASQTYIIGSPFFKQSSIQLESGKTFTVVANGVSDENIYIQSAKLNGKEYTKSYITHQQLMAGGKLEFEMGSTPNKSWGVNDEDLPASKVDIPIDTSVVNSKMTFAPFDPNNVPIFDGQRTIELQCKTPNAKIFYTLNGETPTQKSKQYSSPINIKANTVLKAIAYSEEKGESLMFEREYLEGKTFDAKKLTLEHNATGYGADNGSQLMDLEVSSTNYADGKWTGWNGKDMIATLDLGKNQQFKNVSVGYLTYPGVWIFPPKAIEVYVSEDGKEYSKVAEEKIFIDENHPKEPFVTRNILSMKNSGGRYLKVIARNMMAMPEWHGSSGHKPWIFIDEILVN